MDLEKQESDDPVIRPILQQWVEEGKLHQAATNGKFDELLKECRHPAEHKALLKLACESRDTFDETPLMHAAKVGRLGQMFDACVDSEDRRMLLHSACEKGDDTGVTAVMWAAIGGHFGQLIDGCKCDEERLMVLRSACEKMDEDGRTAIKCAAHYHHLNDVFIPEYWIGKESLNMLAGAWGSSRLRDEKKLLFTYPKADGKQVAGDEAFNAVYIEAQKLTYQAAKPKKAAPFPTIPKTRQTQPSDTSKEL